MDFAFTPEQELLRRTARDVLEASAPMSFVRAMMDDPRGIDPGQWQRMAALGWQGMALGEDVGGASLGMIELAIVLEEMGRALLPGPFLSTVVAALAIARGASPTQRARWLPGVCSGSTVATLAWVEDGGSWDLDAVATVARPDGDDLLLTGRKPFVADARASDLLLCVARRPDGTLALVALEPPLAGLSIRPMDGIDATRKLGALELEGARVPGSAVLACDAPAVLGWVLDRARIALAAEMAGGAARVLELTVEYAKVRQQFGQPIGGFQAVQHACADMMVAVECAKTAASFAAWTADHAPDETSVAAAMAKAAASDAYRAVTARAIGLHGGIGFTWEHDLHLFYRRALASAVAFGDATWSREQVARGLGL